MQMRSLLVALALAGGGLALPTGAGTLTPPAPRTIGQRDGVAAVPAIEAIMPSSTSCAGRGDECTTAEDAAEYLIGAMAEYTVGTVEMAGILALIAYESGEMQYKKNTNQATNLGRGTANMQSGDYNVQFAADLGLGSYTTATVLDLVSTNNKFNFYSGAWFLTTQCPSARYSSGDVDSWFESYMACVGLSTGWQTSQPKRETYWESAKTAFGL